MATPPRTQQLTDRQVAPLIHRARAERRVSGTFVTFLIFTGVGLVAGAVSVAAGFAVGLPDAESHTTIARRIWDGPDPGVGQLGTVWLPVPHIALAPFTAISLFSEAWFSAGWSGVLLSSLCLGITCAALFRIMVRVGVTNRYLAWAGLAVMALNPTMLYLYTTAMMEPVLLAAVAASCAGIAGALTAVHRYTGGEIAVYAGLPAAAATGSRYDGWIFAAIAGLVLLILGWRRFGGFRVGVRWLLAFGIPSALVALWWFLINWTTFGDPLAFQRGEYSAQFQQDQLTELGVLPTNGSFTIAATTFAQTVGYVITPVIIVLTLIAALVFIVRVGTKGAAAAVWLLAFFGPYYVVALYLGQAVIRHWETEPPGLFNFRYAAPLLLPAAVLIAYLLTVVNEALAERFRWTNDRAHAPIVPVVLASGLVLLVAFTGWRDVSDRQNPAAILAEVDWIKSNGAQLTEAADYLNAHYEGGAVLVDEVDTPILVRMGLPFDELVARFSDDFETVAARPDTEWIVYRERDTAESLWTRWRNIRPPGYSEVFRADDVLVLRRDQGGEQR